MGIVFNGNPTQIAGDRQKTTPGWWGYNQIRRLFGAYDNSGTYHEGLYDTNAAGAEKLTFQRVPSESEQRIRFSHDFGAADALIERYDNPKAGGNGDGYLQADELDRCPWFKSFSKQWMTALDGRFDPKQKDEKLNRRELALAFSILDNQELLGDIIGTPIPGANVAPGGNPANPPAAAVPSPNMTAPNPPSNVMPPNPTLPASATPPKGPVDTLLDTANQSFSRYTVDDETQNQLQATTAQMQGLIQQQAPNAPKDKVQQLLKIQASLGLIEKIEGDQLPLKAGATALTPEEVTHLKTQLNDASEAVMGEILEASAQQPPVPLPQAGPNVLGVKAGSTDELIQSVQAQFKDYPVQKAANDRLTEFAKKNVQEMLKDLALEDTQDNQKKIQQLLQLAYLMGVSSLISKDTTPQTQALRPQLPAIQKKIQDEMTTIFSTLVKAPKPLANDIDTTLQEIKTALQKGMVAHPGAYRGDNQITPESMAMIKNIAEKLPMLLEQYATVMVQALNNPPPQAPAGSLSFTALEAEYEKALAGTQ